MPLLGRMEQGRWIVDDRQNNRIQIFDQDGRTNTGRFALAQKGYAFNPRIGRGIRIGSARNGSVRSLIPDPCAYSCASGSSLTACIVREFVMALRCMYI